VWSIRFRVSAARDAIEILPPLGEERAAVSDEGAAVTAVPGPALSGSEEGGRCLTRMLLLLGVYRNARDKRDSDCVRENGLC
jgi:hypothetical protein